MRDWIDTLHLEDDELVAQINSDFLNKLIDVRFTGTKELGINQNEVMEGFIKNQDKILDSAFSAIINYYNKAYPHYLEGWSAGGLKQEEIKESLPKGMTKEKLFTLISDPAIFINPEEDCGEGEFGLSLECEWDVEHGIGVKFKRWVVSEVGTSQVSFL